MESARAIERSGKWGNLGWWWWCLVASINDSRSVPSSFSHDSPRPIAPSALSTVTSTFSPSLRPTAVPFLSCKSNPPPSLSAALAVWTLKNRKDRFVQQRLRVVCLCMYLCMLPPVWFLSLHYNLLISLWREYEWLIRWSIDWSVDYVGECEHSYSRTGRMLTCIACSKQQQHQQQLNNGSLQQQDNEDAAATPRTKQAIKALTSQVISLPRRSKLKKYPFFFLKNGTSLAAKAKPPAWTWKRARFGPHESWILVLVEGLLIWRRNLSPFQLFVNIPLAR